MARTLLNSFGPFVNQVSALFDNTSATTFPTGYSAPNTPSPPHGTYWLSADSSATLNVAVGSAAESVGPYDYGWFVLRGFRLTGTLASSQSVRFLELNTNGLSAGVLNLRWIYSSSTDKWKLRVTRGSGGGETTIATGTTELSTATTYTIRVQFDGINITIWVNGSQEIQAAYGGKMDSRLTRLHASDLNSGQAHFWNRGALYGGAMASDRPGTDVESDLLTMSGDTAEDDYAIDGACLDTDTGLATYTKWNDWESGAPDGDGGYNCATGNVNWSQLSALNTHAMDGVVSGVIYRIWSAANVGSKTVDNWARLGDGSNTAEIQLPNMGSATYFSRIRLFDTAPDGGAWTQGDIDNLEVGHRITSGNNANAKCSAVSVEVIAVDDDPPTAAVAATTTSGVALGSSNVGIP